MEVDVMNMIRPVSDLRNNFADISKTVSYTHLDVYKRQYQRLCMKPLNLFF